MKKLTKIISVLVLLFTIFASLGSSMIETAEATGNNIEVILHKKKMLAPLPQLKQNTGEEMPHFDQYDDYTDGAEFKVYDVTAAFYARRAAGDSVEQATQFVQTPASGATPIFTGTTDATGTLNFNLNDKSGGKDAVYLFVESDIEGVGEAENMVLSFPVYAIGSDGKYTNKKLDKVHLYPKNIIAAAGNLIVTKIGTANGEKLNGAEFVIRHVRSNRYIRSSANGIFTWTENLNEAFRFLTGNSYSKTASGIEASDIGVNPGELLIQGFEPGNYELIEDKAPANAAIIDSEKVKPFTIVANKTDAETLTVRNDTVEINKHHKGPKVDYNVGENIPYSITLNIPEGMGDKVGDTYKHPSLIITDTPDKGLQFRNITSLKFGDTTITNFAGWMNTDGNGFVMTIPASDLAAYAGQTLTIAYNMYLDGKAVPDKGYNNIAKVTTSRITDQDKDNPEVFTGGRKFLKKDQNFDENNGLNGAEFVIRNADANDAKYLKIAEGTKAISWVNTLAEATTFESVDGGLFEVAGLEYGTYYLEETAAPEDYVLLEERIPFTVAQGSYNETLRLDIKNIRKGRLPSTGGSGIVGFIGLGAVLVASTGGYYIKRKRD